MIRLDKSEVYRNLTVPDTWSNLREFAIWYMQNNTPLIPPPKARVFTTDDASAVCLFRKGVYQVELYLIHSQELVEMHCHPGVEIVQMHLSGEIAGHPEADCWGQMYPLALGKYHGGGEGNLGATARGISMLVFQKWPKDSIPTSASVAWRGPVAGPVHKALIESYYPGVMVDMISKLTEQDILAYKKPS